MSFEVGSPYAKPKSGSFKEPINVNNRSRDLKIAIDTVGKLIQKGDFLINKSKEVIKSTSLKERNVTKNVDPIFKIEEDDIEVKGESDTEDADNTDVETIETDIEMLKKKLEQLKNVTPEEISTLGAGMWGYKVHIPQTSIKLDSEKE